MGAVAFDYNDDIFLIFHVTYPAFQSFRGLEGTGSVIRLSLHDNAQEVK